MQNYEKLRRQILKRIQKELKPKRYLHTLGVESAAIALARQYHASEEEASIAALLHDIAKYISQEDSLQMLEGTGILEKYPELTAQPQLLHAFAGAELVHRDYPELSEDIVHSVRYHTTGRPDMSVLEKIIFSADYIEPGRADFPGLHEARIALFEDLDAGVYRILQDTVHYIEGQDHVCFILTKEACEFMKALVNS